MRAGLLSDPAVMQLVNETFVPTWSLTVDLERQAEEGNQFAKTLIDQWEYPVDLMFLSPDGRFLGKLNSFKDFPNVHANVATPPGKELPRGMGPTHSDVFLRYVEREFGKE